jgi:hypothetical protein
MRSIRLAALALAVPLLAAPLLASCSTSRERMAAELSEVQRHAGDPVNSLQFFRMDRFEILGRDSIVLWTRPNQAWLIEVDEPCFGLDFATSVGVTSNMNRVYRNSDFVVFKDQRCRIDQIRPIDVKALKAERRGEAPAPDASGD